MASYRTRPYMLRSQPPWEPNASSSRYAVRPSSDWSPRRTSPGATSEVMWPQTAAPSPIFTPPSTCTPAPITTRSPAWASRPTLAPPTTQVRDQIVLRSPMPLFAPIKESSPTAASFHTEERKSTPLRRLRVLRVGWGSDWGGN